MKNDYSMLDCIQFSGNELPPLPEEFPYSWVGQDPKNIDFRAEFPQEFPGIGTTCECSGVDSKEGGMSADAEKTDQLKKEILASAEKLLKPSKKISKRGTGKPLFGRKVKENPISLENAKKLSIFFKKWKELRKKSKTLKSQIKHWFSSFDLKMNKTYIYREFFNEFRVHFRLAVREGGFAFQDMKEDDWKNMFVALTGFLMGEVERIKETILKGKKCQVYPVWIDGPNNFTLGGLSTHID